MKRSLPVSIVLLALTAAMLVTCSCWSRRYYPYSSYHKQVQSEFFSRGRVFMAGDDDRCYYRWTYGAGQSGPVKCSFGFFLEPYVWGPRKRLERDSRKVERFIERERLRIDIHDTELVWRYVGELLWFSQCYTPVRSTTSAADVMACLEIRDSIFGAKISGSSFVALDSPKLVNHALDSVVKANEFAIVDDSSCTLQTVLIRTRNLRLLDAFPYPDTARSGNVLVATLRVRVDGRIDVIEMKSVGRACGPGCMY